MRVLITTGGTRGDVQPCVALGQGLRQQGIDVRVATAASFEDFVRDAGLDFYGVSIDLQQLLNELLEDDSTNPIRHALAFRKHLEPLLETNVEEFSEAGRDADLILYTPATFIAQHVARYLGIPSVSGEMQPALRGTGEFRSSIVPSLPDIANPRLRGIVNRLSYVFAHETYWHVFKGPINRILTQQLGLPPVNSLNSPNDRAGHDGKPEAVLCGWSPQILSKPRDWTDEVSVTGYWFLEEQQRWQPPGELEDFLEAGPKPISIGFGSTSNLDPESVAKVITAALQRTGNRAVLLTGWSELDRVDLPDEVFRLDEAPHEWLFPRVSAAVHHGGSATIGASVRAGIPTITVPFWFDQYFWGERIASLRAGPEPIPKDKLSAQRLSDALHSATTDEHVKDRALRLGEAIHHENGVANAIDAMKTYGVLG